MEFFNYLTILLEFTIAAIKHFDLFMAGLSFLALTLNPNMSGKGMLIAMVIAGFAVRIVRIVLKKKRES